MSGRHSTPIALHHERSWDEDAFSTLSGHDEDATREEALRHDGGCDLCNFGEGLGVRARFPFPFEGTGDDLVLQLQVGVQRREIPGTHPLHLLTGATLNAGQDMELVNEKRQLLCAGKLFRQPDHPFERGQIELFVLLLDNYRQCA